MNVTREQRHLRRHPCPVCGGFDEAPRGKEKRCHGFTTTDDKGMAWANCARSELAGCIDANGGGLYAHRMLGPCKCGTTHREDLRPKTDEIEAIYPYFDEHGTLLFQVVRRSGKRFSQRIPDGAGGWIWKRADRLVLYRLPELLADDADRTVYVVEGEKDADSLAKRGFLATTNPMGAAKFHLLGDHPREVLRDRVVIVIGDGDEAGRRHARQVETTLRDVVRSIKVLEAPAPHKDVTALLQAGGSLEQLVPPSVDAAPDSGESEPADASEIPTADEPLRGLTHLAKVAVVGRERIIELAERPIVWLWEDVATAGLIVLLAAGPGGGKTTLIFMILVARANRGEPVTVLGRKMTPAIAGRFIVLIENEHSDESAARILRKSCALVGVDERALETVILVARSSVRIGSPEWADVETLIAAGLVSDIVLDTLARCTPSASADANSEEEQVSTFELIAQAIERAPTPDARPTVWVAAHTRKVDGIPSLNDVSGSTQRAGQADVVLLMGANRTADRVSSVSVVFGKVREKDAQDWPEPVEYTVTKRGVVIADKDDPSDDRPLEERILARLTLGPRTKNKLATDLARSKADVDAALSVLFETRRIRTTQIVVRGRGCKAFELASEKRSHQPAVEAAE